MRRVSLAVLFVITCAVAAGVVYVVTHNPTIPDAGTTPSLSSATSPSPDPSIPTKGSDAPSHPETSSDSSSAPPTAKIAFLGDDYTVGRGAKPRSRSWTQLLADKLSVQTTEVGAVGAGYAKRSPAGKTYQSLVAKIVASAPDIVVVSGGRNDVGDDAATLRAAAHSLFAELHRQLPHAQLLAIAPWWGDSPHPAQLSVVDNAVRDGVLAAGGSYIDKTDPLQGHPNFMSDAADPDNSGYRAIARSLASSIGARLPR